MSTSTPTPTPNEPIAREAAVHESLEVDSTTEPDAGSDSELDHVLVSHRSAQGTTPNIILTRPQHDGDSGFSDLSR